MSSLRLAEFHHFDVNDEHKDSRIVVDWEKCEGHVVRILYTTKHTKEGMTECDDIETFPLTKEGEDEAIDFAIKLYRTSREEYAEKYCKPNS